MDIEDIGKLKVAELRSILQSKGLDSKGNKPLLVQRLRDALEAELPNDQLDDEAEELIETDPGMCENDSLDQEDITEADKNGSEDHDNNEPCKDMSEDNQQTARSDEECKDESEENLVEIPILKEEVNDEYFSGKKNDYEEAPNEDNGIKNELESNVISEVKREIKEEPSSDVENISKEKDVETDDAKGIKRSQSPVPENQSKDRSKRIRTEDSWAEDEPSLDNSVVTLDWYNSDLSLEINKDNFLKAEPLTDAGFAYVWHGVRSNYGCIRGKVFYEVKITEELVVNHLEKEEQHPHVVRCGWSLDSSSLILGEEKFSYGFGGTGKASTDLKFKDYGKPFGKGDIIGCFLDLDSEPMVMSFTINGNNEGICYEICHDEIQGNALFPHILTKNCVFEVNFGTVSSWYEPLIGYLAIGKIALDDLVIGTLRPKKREETEVIMMVGLPAAGKSTWVEKYMKEHPDRKYNVLSTNNLIDRMRVMGLPRKRNYAGRWESLIEKCTKCLNKLLYMSSKRRRNFIIDQTNVYPSAQKRKMKGFIGCTRRAVVICPTDDDLKLRTKKRQAEEGKDVPDRAVLEMKANFQLPEVGEFFDSVEFVELGKEESIKLIEQYNKEGERAGFGPRRMGGGRGFGGGGGSNRRGNFNNDRRPGGYNHRGGNYRGGWDRDRDRRGQFDRRDRSGGWNRDSRSDFRDNNRSGGHFNRDNRSGGGFNRDRQNRQGGGSGGSSHWSGGYKGSQNQNNGGRSNSGWGNYNQGNQNYANQNWGSQASSYQGWSNPAQQQGYNWNQQYYGQGQSQQQQQPQQYWQGYANQTGYPSQTGYSTQGAYGSTAATNYGSYTQQNYSQGQTQQQTQWAGTYGTPNYGQSNEYRK